MITPTFLVEWAVRSSILMGSGALLLWLLRVKAPSIRLAACIAALCASLSMPLLTAMFPKLPVFVTPASAVSNPGPIAPAYVVASRDLPQSRASSQSDRWDIVAVSLYALISGLLLLRLSTGLLLARNLRRRSRATVLTAGGAEVRESGRVTSPVTVGIARPVIVLPSDWREWGEARLNAVLAHEESHVRRNDPAVQFLSALHRALLWHSPLSWMLHRSIVRLAEDVSDDDAVAVTRDRASYAQMLLDFMQRGVRVNWQGVAMARYGCPDDRIHRILNSTILSTGVTRGAVAAIVTLAVPLAYLTAAAVPARAVRSVGASPAVVSKPASTSTVAAAAQVAFAQTPAAPATSNVRSDAAVRRYLIVMGDNQHGSWDSRDSVTPEALRARFGNRFAWFRQGSKEHVITDEGVLQDIQRAMEPQNKVNAQQDQVNRLQSTINNLQSKVNSRQGEVNAAQGKVNSQQDKVNAAQTGVNKRQDLLNRIQDAGSRESKEAAIRKVEALLNELRAASGASSQEDVSRLQEHVNAAQTRVNQLQNEVNREQDSVNTEQQKVNLEQEKVNEVQRQVSEEFSKRIQEIFQSALRRGLAKIVN